MVIRFRVRSVMSVGHVMFIIEQTDDKNQWYNTFPFRPYFVCRKDAMDEGKSALNAERRRKVATEPFKSETWEIV